MTTPEDRDLPGDRNLMAAELALGLLEGEERAAARREQLRDPAFAAMVERWRERFAGFYAESAEATPDAALESRVLAAIAPRPGGVAPLWRTAAAVAGLLAVCLLLVVLMRPVPPVVVPAAQPAPPLVAAMAPTPDGAGKPFIAIYDRATGQVRLAGGTRFPPDRSAELWAIGGDGTPRALGLFSRDATPRLRLAHAAPAPGETLAISIERRGGSRKPGPEGPVVATGTLAVS